MKKVALLALVVALGMLVLPLLRAQEEEGKTLSAPEWKAGSWWKIKVWTRRIETGRMHPGLKKGLEPPEIPGYPRLKGGIPKGFKESYTYLFEVLGVETISIKTPVVRKHDELVPPQKEAKGAKKEDQIECHKIKVSIPEGARKFEATLYYAVEGLRLVRIDTLNGSGKKSSRSFRGEIVFDPDMTGTFGFPLTWPCFSKLSTGSPYSTKVHGKGKVVQELKGEKDTYTICLKYAEKESKFAVIQTWKSGDPWWLECSRGDMLAKCIEKGTK